MDVAREQERAYASLIADMRLALLSEIGARSIYDHSAGAARTPSSTPC